MFGSTVLEVVVGLTFCYASVALIVSTLQEALAAALRLRANCLFSGIKNMLNDPAGTELARTLYSHALVNPHVEQARPAYIEPAHFAIALVDALHSIPGDVAQLGRDIDKFHSALADWFDSAMGRVSAAYKRRAMMISLALSLLLAVLFNIDSIHLFQSLWQHPALSAQLGAVPAALDQHALDAMWQLPIGWQQFPPRMNGQFAISVAGWLVTASSALFGAPFWFNLMKRAVDVRATQSH